MRAPASGDARAVVPPPEMQLTVASAADSWLVDPRAGCNKAYITTLVCNRHLLIVDLPHAIQEVLGNSAWNSTSPSSSYTT